MNDKEIIEALDLCTQQNGSIPCYDCPCWNDYEQECKGIDYTATHDLITRQQAKIENLKVENQSLKSAANSLKMHYEEAQAEIENLKNENFILSQKRANIFEITDAYGRGRSKAVKEFTERLCEDRASNDTVVIAAKCLLKEMVGEINSDE